MATSRHKCDYCLNVYVVNAAGSLAIYYDESMAGCDYCKDWRADLVKRATGQVEYKRMPEIEVKING